MTGIAYALSHDPTFSKRLAMQPKMAAEQRNRLERMMNQEDDQPEEEKRRFRVARAMWEKLHTYLRKDETMRAPWLQDYWLEAADAAIEVVLNEDD